MTRRPLRLGLVGLGPWGRNLGRVLGSLREAELVAVCDRDPEPLAAVSAATLAGPDPEPLAAVSRAVPSLFAARNYGELLSLPGLDAVLIATPPDTHAELALAALGRGLHVFVEKPMALRLSDAIELCAARDRARRLLMVGHILLYHPAVIELRRLLDRGKLGTLERIETERLGAVTRHGNAWWTLAPHDLSLAVALARCWPETISLVRAGSGDRVRARLRFPGGAAAELVVGSFGSPGSPKTRRLAVVGTGGRATFDDTARSRTLRIEQPGCASSSHAVPAREPLEVELEAFVHAAREGARVESDAELGLGVTRLLLAGEESLRRGGRAVELEAASPWRADVAQPMGPAPACADAAQPTSPAPARADAAQPMSPASGLDALA
jgi:predicted dehydrogenase